MIVRSTSIRNYCRGFCVYRDANRNPVFVAQIGVDHYLLCIGNWTWHRRRKVKWRRGRKI